MFGGWYVVGFRRGKGTVEQKALSLLVGPLKSSIEAHKLQGAAVKLANETWITKEGDVFGVVFLAMPTLEEGALNKRMWIKANTEEVTL